LLSTGTKTAGQNRMAVKQEPDGLGAKRLRTCASG
jgi:hypothetical protein